MEHLEVFDYSNILIACYFNDDRGCAHENREHTLIYLCSGELEIEERGKKTVLYPGECAFMRRDNRMWLHKKVENGKPYRSIVLKFLGLPKGFLSVARQPAHTGRCQARQDKPSRPPPTARTSVHCSESVIPYFGSRERNPPKTLLKLEMTEGVWPYCSAPTGTPMRPVRFRGTVEDRHPRLP